MILLSKMGYILEEVDGPRHAPALRLLAKQSQQCAKVERTPHRMVGAAFVFEANHAAWP